MAQVIGQGTGFDPLAFLDRRSPHPRLTSGLKLAALAAAGVVLVRTAWLGDDAYITLRTVSNFLHGYGLRFNIAERVQAYTHPLWMWQLAPSVAHAGSAYAGAIGLGLLCSLLTFALLIFRARRPLGPTLLATLTLLLSRAFVDYSSSGLENPLTHLLLAGFLLALPADRPTPRDLLLAGALAGLAAWNRLDTLLLFAPALAYSLWRFREKRGLWLAGAGFAPLLVWELFATFYYGFPYPNTAVAKLHSGIGEAALMRQGLFYFADSLRRDPVTLPVILFGLALAARSQGGRDRAVGLGLLLYLLYVVSIGGDFMSGRYLSAPLLGATLLILRAGFLGKWARPALAVLLMILSAVTPYRSVTSGADFGLYAANVVDAHGICDERRYYFGWSGWLCRADVRARPLPAWTHDGRVADQAQAPLLAEGAIGVTAFYAGPQAHMLDRYGLSEPLLARLPAVRRDVVYDRFLQGTNGAPAGPGWRIGHFLRNVPPGYMATLLEGSNRLEDPELARYYDHLSLVIRGPLFSARRLAEIVRLNLGSYDALVPRGRPDYRPLDWSEAMRARPASAYFRLRMGLAESDEADEEAAEADLREAVRLAPGLGEAWAALGSVRQRRGDPAQAAACWERALAVDPDVTRCYWELGDYRMGQEKFDEAISLFTRGLARDPSGTAVFNDLGTSCAALGKNAEALSWFEQSVRYLPEDPWGWDNLGLARMALGDPRRARRAFARSIRLKADDQNLMHAGLADSERGEKQSAMAEMRRAVSLNPDNLEAWFYLGAMLSEGHDPGGSLECWRRSARGGYGPAQDSLRVRHLDW